MSELRSGIAPLIEQFVRFRKASGTWNESNYGQNIRLFDYFCANNYKACMEITQEIVDSWCGKRSTESNSSNGARTRVVRAFIGYLRERELTNAHPPAILKHGPMSSFPHAFEDDELSRFFRECDNILPHQGRKASVIRKLAIPVFFRLLYSSGIRTTEARLLRLGDVDLESGILDIQQSKGHDQHYIALHDTMSGLMRRYDQAISRLQPGRTYFFQSSRGSHLSKDWVQRNFRTLWSKANGRGAEVVAYAFRHHYAIENINSWIDDGFEFSDKLHYLSKSMGHRSIEATRYYYSIVPRLADTLRDRTEEGFNAIVPEVGGDEE